MFNLIRGQENPNWVLTLERFLHTVRIGLFVVALIVTTVIVFIGAALLSLAAVVMVLACFAFVIGVPIYAGFNAINQVVTPAIRSWDPTTNLALIHAGELLISGGLLATIHVVWRAASHVIEQRRKSLALELIEVAEVIAFVALMAVEGFVVFTGLGSISNADSLVMSPSIVMLSYVLWGIFTVIACANPLMLGFSVRGLLFAVKKLNELLSHQALPALSASKNSSSKFQSEWSEGDSSAVLIKAIWITDISGEPDEVIKLLIEVVTVTETQALKFVDELPNPILVAKAVAQDEAAELMSRFQAAGATVQIED